VQRSLNLLFTLSSEWRYCILCTHPPPSNCRSWGSVVQLGRRFSQFGTPELLACGDKVYMYVDALPCNRSFVTTRSICWEMLFTESNIGLCTAKIAIKLCPNTVEMRLAMNTFSVPSPSQPTSICKLKIYFNHQTTSFHPHPSPLPTSRDHQCPPV